MKNKRNKIIELILVVSILFVLLIIIINHFSTEIEMLSNPNISKEILSKQVRSHGPLTGILLLVVIIILCIIPGLPTSFVGVFAGVVFGPVVGSFISISGNLIGNLLAILVMTYIPLKKGDELSNKLQKKVLTKKHSDIMLSMSYMIPVVPSFAVNYVMSQLKFNLLRKIKVILLGIIPMSILYAFGGNSLLTGDIKIILATLVVIIIFILGISLLKKRLFP